MIKNMMGCLVVTCSIMIMLTRASSSGTSQGGLGNPEVGEPSHWNPKMALNSSSSLHTTGLFNLGTVNGKSFYADMGKHAGWKEASRHCSSLGMELASLDTPQEWTHVRESLEKVPVLEWVIFWLSGRESRSEGMFQWDNSKLPLNPAVVQYFNTKFIRGFDYYTCLTLYNIPPGASSETSYGIYPFPCLVGNHVMCQSLQ